MSTKQYVIETRGLVKDFGKFRALNQLDLQVAPGEVHGFLGPNGSGKSTTIRILLGLLHKTAGSATLLGADPWSDAVALHKRLAYVPGDVSLWPNLTGGESIDLLGRLRGGLDEKRRAELIHRFQLDPAKKFSTYSKGNRQKVALIAALASDVELYILDEPTSGLDPLMEAAFQDCVVDLKRRHKTILLSSHILAEVEALCDRLTIIREGKTVQSGTLADLRYLRRTTVNVRTTKPAEILTTEGVHNQVISRDEHGISFEVDAEALDGVLAELTTLGVQALTSHPPSLEELFLAHYDTKSDAKG
ncbi:ABC transporter ATP-binding protein [Candidatus Saccharibacteria bacterium]|nr:MAG: ABC transporter ATP-binding protein [Candidatus Saccharibacteria bacterium]